MDYLWSREILPELASRFAFEFSRGWKEWSMNVMAETRDTYFGKWDRQIATNLNLSWKERKLRTEYCRFYVLDGNLCLICYEAKTRFRSNKFSVWILAGKKETRWRLKVYGNLYLMEISNRNHYYFRCYIVNEQWIIHSRRFFYVRIEKKKKIKYMLLIE